ncbi:O-antigen ligase family protein [Pseudooceanicola sp. LIPI14-2-Ac024]|uniref:O-antigen ligase family protein n=1 Tax=Pseudooceanicola sp. LIPI14-2-Ac024 TaxID=3344875 RepID=UPI0035D00906
MPKVRIAHHAFAIDGRTVELVAIGLALTIQSGAIFPMLFSGGTGFLDAAAEARLRMLSLPIYLVAITLVLGSSAQFLIAVRRSVPLLVFYLLPLLSVMWSISPALSLRRAVALLLSLLFAYAIAIRTTPTQLLRIFTIMIGILMGLSLLLMGAAPHVAFMPDEGSLRGVFTHKNSLGWISALGVVVSGLALYIRVEGFRRIGIVALLLSLACLVLSQSVTSLFSVFIAATFIGFYELLKSRNGLSRFMFGLISIELGILLMIGLSSYLPLLLEALGKDPTLTGRVPLWGLVDDRIAMRPLLGHGYQAFWTEANPGAWEIWGAIQWRAPHAHNGYRDLLLSVGVVGFAVMAAILVPTIRDGVRLHCQANDMNWLFPNVIVAQILVINLTESNLLGQTDIQWTLVTVSLIWIMTRTREAAVLQRRAVLSAT